MNWNTGTRHFVPVAFCGLAAVLLGGPAGPVSAQEKGRLPIIPGAHGFGMGTPAGSGRHLNLSLKPGWDAALVGHWSFDDGLPKDRTAVGAPALVARGKGQALSLDGKSVLKLSNPKGYVEAGGSFTVMGWIHAEAPGGVLAQNATEAGGYWMLSLNRNGSVFQVRGDDGARSPAGTRGLTAAKWRHVAGVYEGTTGELRLYVEGIPMNRYSNARVKGLAAAQSCNLSVGRRVKGLIDEVMLFSAVLTDEQVLALCASQYGSYLGNGKTRVIKVTNLNDSGPGSLRAALEAAGPRVVVFEVSGYITLKHPIGISHPYVTVAGQTAPWPGIVVRGYAIQVRANDVLIQHLGVRTGGQWEGWHWPHRHCMGVLGNRNVIDHCSFGWSTQVAMAVGGPSGRDITVRNCLFSEGLYSSGHCEPHHSVAVLVNPRTRSFLKDYAMVGNLIAHTRQRNPEVLGNLSMCFLNNVIYDYQAVGLKVHWGDHLGPRILSVIGNTFIRGVDNGGRPPDRPWFGDAMWIYSANPESRIFISSDNLLEGKIHDNPWECELIDARRSMGEPDRKPEPKSIVQAPPIGVPGYRVLTARETEQWVLANVGPFPARRNPIDARIVYETRTRTGRGRDDVEDAGGWPKLEENHRELALPESPNADADGDGYTNLEEWLHGYADEVEKRPTPIAAGAPADLGKREAERCAFPRATMSEEEVAELKNTRQDWAFNAEEAERRQKLAAAKAGLDVNRLVDLDDAVAIEMALIPAGEFMMGSKYPMPAVRRRDPGANVGLLRRDYPPHRVRLTKPYYMSKYELTEDVWEKVMGKRQWKYPGARRPAVGVTWTQVQKFVGELNKTAGPRVGLKFRPPTEAEWEWACRAGTDTAFHFGEKITPELARYGGGLAHAGGVSWDGVKWINGRDDIDVVGNSVEEWILASSGPVEVGRSPANAWGLHDMSGNASEWVQDVYAPYPAAKETLVDPVGPTPEEVKKVQGVEIRVIRGGSWGSTPGECQSSASSYYLYHARGSFLGFHLAAEPMETREAGK